MANKDGVITRKDIIEDEALKFGEVYANNLQVAIKSNRELVESVKELNKQVQLFKVASSEKDYISVKRLNQIETQKAIDLLKIQEAAEISNDKIKRSAILTMEAERKVKQAVSDAEIKSQKIKETSIKLSIEEKLQLQQATSESKRNAIANGALANAYKELSAKMGIAGDKVKNIIATGKLASESQNQYNQRLKQAQTEFEKLNGKVRAADAAVGQFNRNVGNYPTQAVEGLKNLISAFGALTGISLFAKIMKEAFTITKDFQKEIVNLAAIAGKSREEIAPLEQKIREVSKASINGATDVAKLATELIKLGSTPEEAEKLLEPINNLSVALQASAEDSATLVKSLLNSFGEGAEEAAHFTDVLAESANRSALDFQGLRDSFSYLAPASRALGISVEKTAAIIGTLADNGIKAESAGRLTSTAFARLANQGLTLEDALKKINKAQKDGSSQLEVLSLASNLFGAEAGKIGLILANNTEKINESTIAYENSDGALKELTEKQLKSLDAELKILSSSWEDYILDTDASSGSTITLSNGVRFLSTNLKTIINVLVGLGAVWLAYKASLVVANVQTKLLALNTKIVEAAQLRNAIATGTATEAQLANAGATNVATLSWQRFSAVLKANALFLILSGLIAAVYYLNKFSKSLSEITEETKSSTDAFLKNREEVSKNTQSIRTLSDRYDVLKSKSKLTKEEQKELDEILKILAKTVPDAVTEVDKYGDALATNTVKTREFIVAQEELIKLETDKKLKDNIKLLGRLKNEQKDLNDLTNKNVSENLSLTYIEEIGYLTRRNGVVLKYNEYLGTTRQLTDEERISWKKYVVDNEKNLAIVQQNINLLSGKTKAEKEATKAAEEAANKKQTSTARTIAIIDSEIKVQEDLISTLSDKTGKQGNAIKAKIEALKAEREQIYSTQKAENAKFDNGLKRYKDVKDAIYQLSQFRYQNEININQKIIDSENETTDKKIEALNKVFELKKAKNLESLENDLRKNAFEKEDLDKLSKTKLEIFKKDTQNRIDSLISGKIAHEQATNEEKLILEKYYAEKKQLQEDDAKKEQEIIDNEVVIAQKKVDAILKSEDTKLNGKLLRANQDFQDELEALKGNQQAIEDATKDHEAKVLKIKQDSAKEALQTQIDNTKILLENSELSSDVRQELLNKLSKLELELNQIGLDSTVEGNKKKVLSEEEYAEKIKEMSMQLKDALVDFTNAIFDGRIQRIDDEIARNDEYYAKQMELAGNDQAQKDLLAEEAEKKRKKLEEEKRKEQRKQAIFNKAMAALDIGVQTGLAIVKAVAASPTTGGLPFSAIAAGIGALQLAAVLAKPIPKYKGGRKGGPEELAYVGDGGVREVIERVTGAVEITPATDTLVKLNAGDKVHSSVEEYNKLQRAAIMASLNMQGRKSTEFQANYEFEKAYGKELLEELKRNTKATEKNKQNIIIKTQSVDIPHAIWKSKNTNWS